MKIELAQLAHEPGAVKTFAFVLTPVATDEREYALRSPLQVEGSLTNTGNGFHLQLRLAALLELACSRCLGPVPWQLDVVLDEDSEEDGAEGQLSPGDVLDVESIALEYLEASLPMQVLCREDCRGLCPLCGQPLNEGDCACSGTEVDPRLAVLQAWREKQ